MGLEGLEYRTTPLTTDKIWKGVANKPTEVDMPGGLSGVIWVQPYYVTGTGAVLSSTYLGYPGALCANNQDDQVEFSIPIPTGFTTLLKAVIRILPKVAGGPGNLYHQCSSKWAAVGEAHDTHTDSIAVAAAAVVSVQMYEYDISAALTGIAAGDTVGFNYTRVGANALDTFEEAIHVLGLLIEYE